MMRTLEGPAMAADPAKLLEQLPLFYDFSHEEIKKIAAIAEEVRFAPRQIVYLAGDRADRVYLVISGLVRMAARDDDQTTPDDVIVRSRGLFGEDCAFDGSQRSLSAMAIMRTHCLALSREGLARLEEQQPRIALKLTKKLARTTSMRLQQAAARIPSGAFAEIAPLEPDGNPPALVNRTIGRIERALAVLVTVRKPRAV